ncbi:MAG: metallopeptidase TldD-related protein [bacterium]
MPVYGLEAVIEQNIETVCGLLCGHIPFAVLPVDDGSLDRSSDALRRAAAKDPEHVRPVFVAVNAGKGNALKRGFAASRGSHILLLDGDLDLAPARITTFFDIMAEKRAAIVIGSKRHPDSVVDYPWHRRLASAVYFTLVRLLVGLPISDTQTGMKLFTRDALGWAFGRMLVKAFAFDLEILTIAHAKGYSVAEAPVEEKVRRALRVEAAGLESSSKIKGAMGAGYQDGTTFVYLANSNGVAGWFPSSGCGGAAEFSAAEGADQQSGSFFRSVVQFADFDPDEVGRKAADNAVRMLGAKPIPSCEIPMVVSPEVGSEILSFVVGLLSADEVQKGRSSFAGKIGTAVAAPPGIGAATVGLPEAGNPVLVWIGGGVGEAPRGAGAAVPLGAVVAGAGAGRSRSQPARVSESRIRTMTTRSQERFFMSIPPGWRITNGELRGG